MSTPRDALELFAIAAPGLETLVRQELAALGATVLGAELGGVRFTADRALLYRANLWLRTASRVIARIGEFRARAFGELERRTAQQPWTRVLDATRPVRLRVTCRKSRLYHSGAVAERVMAAIARAVGTNDADLAPPDDDEVAASGQLVIVRLLHDVCTLSADTSGALLHRRGYRLATAKAPMRETLGAALLLASGYTGAAPLVDPLCGAGTIPIEAALIARRIAPGARRDFAFMRWPEFDAALWAAELGEARAGERPRAPAAILGSDRDVGAIEAAVANAERASVNSDIIFERKTLSAVAPPPAPGWLVTNPPYGARVGDASTLRNLYAQLGNVARQRCPGWTIALAVPNARLEHELRMPLETRVRTRSGGLPIRLVTGLVTSADPS